MKSSSYKESFDLFLERTDEKKVIIDFIKKKIPLHKRMKVLDIGAGNGTLARVLSKSAGSVVVVEPNSSFLNDLKHIEGITVIHSKWENVCLNDTYDFILAAYVITYLPKKTRAQLIRKIYDSLATGGNALILSVDASRGSWRKIYAYFYKLMGYKHQSSDDEMKKVLKKYRPIKKVLKTQVVAKNETEMLKILSFDFGKYPEEYKKFSEKLRKFLHKYTDGNGQVTLEVVHNAYIISK